MSLETETSASLGALFAALAKAQGAYGVAKKDKTNPHFGSKYADLASVMEACRPALSVNGLAVIQAVAADSTGQVRVITTLGHASGEWVRSSLMVAVEGGNRGVNANQALALTVTYAKRVAYSAMVGIAPDDDDDGNAATAKAAKAARKPEREDPPTSATAPAVAAPTPQASVYVQAMALIRGAEAPGKVDDVLKRAQPKVTVEEFAALEAVGKQRREALARLLAPKPPTVVDVGDDETEAQAKKRLADLVMPALPGTDDFDAPEPGSNG